MQDTPSSQNLTTKLVSTLLILLIDLIISSFVECSFSQSWIAPTVINFYLIPIQLLMVFLSLVMVLVMMWGTFPLRYGLIGPLFSEFKYTFLVFVLFFATTALERGLKLALVIQGNFSQSGIWDNGFYTFAYYLRFLSYPLYYGFIVMFCIRIIHPSFYKPDKWLK